MPIPHTCHLAHETPPTTTPTPIRAFDPSWNKLYIDRPDDLFSECASCGENRLFLPATRSTGDDTWQQPIDDGAIVVSLGSAARTGGDGPAQASFGVYWGSKSLHNGGEKVVDEHPVNKSIEGAIILAGIVALLKILKQMDSPESEDGMCCIAPHGMNICKVLILTDSTYLVKAMSEYIWKWKRNGFKTAKKQPVANREGLMDLDFLIEMLEERDVAVWFWGVGKGDITEANGFAKGVLDGEEKMGRPFEWDYEEVIGGDDIFESEDDGSDSGESTELVRSLQRFSESKERGTFSSYNNDPNSNETKNKALAVLDVLKRAARDPAIYNMRIALEPENPNKKTVSLSVAAGFLESFLADPKKQHLFQKQSPKS